MICIRHDRFTKTRDKKGPNLGIILFRSISTAKVYTNSITDQWSLDMHWTTLVKPQRGFRSRHDVSGLPD